MFHFYCHNYFHYDYFTIIYYFCSPVISEQVNLHNTQTKVNCRSFLKHSRGKTTKTIENYSQSKAQIRSVPNFNIGVFWNSTIYSYLAYSKDEKWRVFNEYYRKLVLKYFGGKNIFFCLVVLKFYIV